jgi:ubiquinone/menaquinone biosynthesis C-methylase UbiE
MSSNDERVHHPIFARLYARLSAAAERQAQAEHRDRALTGLQGRVIELGAGTGLNFPHYPLAVGEVSAVEPESYLRKQTQRAAASAPVPIRVINGHANAIPAEDRSFDAAVALLVLSTVPDPATALQELYRVIRPGGELRFYEYVLADNPALARAQRAADKSGIWPLVGGGCHPARDTENAIRNSGFQIESYDRFNFRPSPIQLIVQPRILGTARKP